MKQLLNQKGFALTEVIVAMTILTIIVASFTALFANGYAGIFSAGYSSKATYLGQESMEKVIAAGSVLGIPDATESPLNLNITFPSRPSESVSGNKVEINKPYYLNENITGTVTITAFIPNN